MSFRNGASGPHHGPPPRSQTAWAVVGPWYVSYLRASTVRQGASGLCLKAQRDAVSEYIRSKGGYGAKLLHEYVEVESGRRDDRPQLKVALRLAQLSGATLVIANLGRLSRNSAFLLTLRDGGAKFVAADLPDVCDLTIGLLATVAQHEREMISKRIREALETKRAALAAEAAAKRARGEDAVRELEDGSSQPLRLGNPNGARCLAGLGNSAAVAGKKAKAAYRAESLRDVLADLDPQGSMSARSLATALNARGFLTPRYGKRERNGGKSWTAQSVIRLRQRLVTP
ncbi:recombinase family protein [Chenggangzhangella methanolivorans]|uniref:recombinase family protein n=1 Tax=Chenggangzhangella methanolivorans TaxID=1437009 RepID=UPI00360C6E2F